MTLQRPVLFDAHVKPESLRPGFSPAALLQASYLGGITDDHRATRPRVLTHPIDNVEPEIPADRDDGIFVDLNPLPNGGHRVHVTIADVAAHIHFRSIVAQTALKRATTLYRQTRTDPMFSHMLEEKMSLEHQQERLGFTVSMDLDRTFQPYHTAFGPTLTHPENMSYAQAAQRIGGNPQLERMAYVAQGLWAKFFTLGKNKDWVRNELPGFPPDAFAPEAHIDTMKMVACYMLLTNHCMAEFFGKIGLPFVYRNFDATEDSARARYGIGFIGHDALSDDMGLQGRYCHFTSPIRRAADFLDLYMAHFAFNTLHGVEQHLLRHYPIADEVIKARLHRGLWEQGPLILRSCPEAASSMIPFKQKLDNRKIIAGILATALGSTPDDAGKVAGQIVERLGETKPPFSRDELQTYINHINLVLGSPEVAEVERENKQHEKLSEVQAVKLETMTPKEFSVQLHRAAQLGVLPDFLFQQAMERFQRKNHNLVNDGFSLLFIAARHHGPEWTSLKRALLRNIKTDTSAITGIIDKAKKSKEFGSRLHETPLPLHDSSAGTSPQREPRQIHATILTLRDDTPAGGATYYAPPFYSVGHNYRAAKSHARWAFLFHMAFGNLQPVDQAALPNLLYADLNMESQSRRELVEAMVKEAGGHMERSFAKVENWNICRLYVSGGRLATPVTAQDTRETQDAAERGALRRLLRNPVFQHAVAPPTHLTPLTNPHDRLIDVATELGYKIDFSFPPTQPKEGFRFEITLLKDAAQEIFTGKGPNKDRARCDAAAKALNFLGASLAHGNTPLNARSWAMDHADHEEGFLHPPARTEVTGAAGYNIA